MKTAAASRACTMLISLPSQRKMDIITYKCIFMYACMCVGVCVQCQSKARSQALYCKCSSHTRKKHRAVRTRHYDALRTCWQVPAPQITSTFHSWDPFLKAAFSRLSSEYCRCHSVMHFKSCIILFHFNSFYCSLATN